MNGYNAVIRGFPNKILGDPIISAEKNANIFSNDIRGFQVIFR